MSTEEDSAGVNKKEEFYVGWSDTPPPKTMAFVRRRVLGLMAAVLVLGVALTASQRPFAESNFEFGVEREFEGVLDHVPFPILVVPRPGEAGGTSSHWLLTVFGKHGAQPFTEDLQGHRVRVTGSLIHRGDAVMVEILPETLEDLGSRGPAASPALSPGEPVQLTGEIVDSKCFLGVMKPGNLKPHRACAVRCISGGVPPVLLTRDGEGNATYHLLVGAQGEAINQDVLQYVAEPVRVRGQLTRLGDMLILRADPADILRTTDR